MVTPHLLNQISPGKPTIFASLPSVITCYLYHINNSQNVWGSPSKTKLPLSTTISHVTRIPNLCLPQALRSMLARSFPCLDLILRSHPKNSFRVITNNRIHSILNHLGDQNLVINRPWDNIHASHMRSINHIFVSECCVPRRELSGSHRISMQWTQSRRVDVSSCCDPVTIELLLEIQTTQPREVTICVWDCLCGIDQSYCLDFWPFWFDTDEGSPVKGLDGCSVVEIVFLN